VDESALQVRPDIEQLVKTRSFLERKKVFTHSGKIVIKRVMSDEDLAEGICSALLLGLSVRLIAKRFCLSTRSVINIRQAMTDRGELAPVRIRLQAKLDQVIELGLERWMEGILDGTIHPGQLPIATLAALDKKGQMDAGLVAGTDRTEAEVLLAQVRAAQELVREMRQAPDSPSADADAQPVDIAAVVVSAEAPATVLAPGLPPAAASPDPTPSPAQPAQPGCAPGSEGGGGVPSSPATQDPQGVTVGNFQP
jgi:hypothetical protein